jgi:uncharacterized membrane protein
MRKLLFVTIGFLVIQFVSAQETTTDSKTTDSNNLIYNLDEIEKIPEFPGGDE